MTDNKQRSVLYPGSFDPLTNGHLDLIRRASLLFDAVYVAVAVNHDKKAMFSTEERIAMIRESCRDLGDKVHPVSFDGLAVDAVERFQVSALLRGLRAFSDFEFELQMALMNRKLREDCETLFMMPSQGNSFISSRLIKEIAQCGGDFNMFVPAPVAARLQAKLGLAPKR
ncbi:MAG: pantetheine-phosphate adenylyltransferase [Victivallales bacterium]|nr:pantetheine-phosphate adenylyltransferase [Victivallales bacterium]